MTERDLKGYFNIVYSPDDEERCGRGYYADMWGVTGRNETSPLYRSPFAARNWARKHGGRIEMHSP